MGNSLLFLGLARRAGALEIGEEPSGSAARAKKARVILICADASENAQKRGKNFSVAGNVPLVKVPFTKVEVGEAVGSGRPSLVAITDMGMAAAFMAKLSAEYPGEYDEAAAAISEKAEKLARRKAEAKRHEKNVRFGKRRKDK